MVEETQNKSEVLKPNKEEEEDVEVDVEVVPSKADTAELDPPKEDTTPKRRTTVHMEVGSMAFDLDVPDDFAEDSETRNKLIQDEEFLQAKGDDVDLYFQTRRINSHTRQCCAFMCGLWILSFGVLVILSVTVGAIEFDISMPFYDRSEINEQREDAYLATQRDADFVATVKNTADGSSLCIHEAPTIMTRNGTLLEGPAPGENCQLASTQSLRILYISSDRESNILTEKNLRRIQEIEEEFLNHQDLSKYCNLIASNYSAFTVRDQQAVVATIADAADATELAYRSCARINSVLNFMDPLYFQEETGLGYHLLQNDLIPQEYSLAQESIDGVIEFWSEYTTQSYDLSAFPAAVATIGNRITLPNMFHRVTSSDFTQGSTEAVGLISSFDMGLPINGYASSSQGVTDQYADVGTWLWEEFDSYLKNAGFEGVDVYFSDTEGTMKDQETGALALQSFSLLPASIIFVLLYLIFMQDSFFIGLVGIMQILLCFIPGIIIYRYVFQIEYIGVLNLIAIYIILGIGVDNIFVFCDQWSHQRREKRFEQRLQKTFNIATKAMFATSCTTFIAFVSNGLSAFPAIRCFGLFAAFLVLINFCAICLFFPAVYGLYFKYIRGKWFDHPSRVFCCNWKEWTNDVYTPAGETEGKDSQENKASDDADATETVSPQAAGKTSEGARSDEGSENEANNLVVKKEAEDVSKESESTMVRFFRDTWAPLMIKLRFVIALLFIGILIGAGVIASQLEPDEATPNTLPDDNNYNLYTDTLLQYFARSGNPMAIKVHWMAGIDPDEPVDRSGTSETNTTDYGVANYVDCSVYNPTTEAAQVWSLQTCHDMFFGNVTEYHGDSSEYDTEGAFGPRQRKLVTDRVPQTEEWYYQLLSCPHQGLRDWLLTDYGCTKLKENGLACYNETRERPGCTVWDTEGNSCEPYPVPEDRFSILLRQFLLDPNLDPMSRKTNYDKYYQEIFASAIPDLDKAQQDQVLRDDFSCRVAENPNNGEGLVLLSITSTATLDQGFEQSYEDGIAMYSLWDEWSAQMLRFAPREMAASMQTSNGAWSYYFLNETLLDETYSNIALSLVLSFIILSVIGGNPIMAFFSVATISMIVVDIFAFTVLMGYKLGVVEAVNYVVVIGLSIDYTVHLCEAYTESHSTDRQGRVVHMLEEMGVSIVSGAFSTLGAVFFMFFAPNKFFVKFASFIFATIILSCIYSLIFFPALLAIIGPTGNVGNCCFWGAKRWRQLKHKIAREYIETEEFRRRELAEKVQQGEIKTLVYV